MNLEQIEAAFGNTSTRLAEAKLNNGSLTFVRLIPVEIACSNAQGLCNALTGLCECEYSFIGPACQYHCLRSQPHGNQVYGPNLTLTLTLIAREPGLWWHVAWELHLE